MDEDPAPYAGLARLLERVRGWRASEAYDQDGEVSLYHAKEMSWCASAQLNSFGACRFRFYYGVFPRCSLCPLFDPRRALLDSLGENPPQQVTIEISLAPDHVCVPDYPPTDWTAPGG